VDQGAKAAAQMLALVMGLLDRLVQQTRVAAVRVDQVAVIVPAAQADRVSSSFVMQYRGIKHGALRKSK